MGRLSMNLTEAIVDRFLFTEGADLTVRRLRGIVELADAQLNELLAVIQLYRVLRGGWQSPP